ncbi:TIGR03364 family FAD-dependent oxidoreductase [Streptomyces albus]|uniref:TIGR03364 family FAD-dependent oxidoreductase n=1 Tax=Streptomyces sp. NRRL F-5639 TaxID=1463867 RepID=UPI0004CBD646|nr:TIGR03364 family FAD-dependent oxidoreductase [Streptomyces sp. NRRL F-5639]KPC73608.1 FAD-dependent oxidoreductase [Streptomyces sp. NRRL F-6602]
MRVIVVGAGVLGTMHAWQAVRRGHEVVHLEREEQARGASVRNFGLVWVGGRADGPELEAALRARELWEEIGDRVPALGFRAGGSLTAVTTEAELAVARAAAERPDAARRGYHLLDADQVRELNPALRGSALLGGLWCERDAAVEPRTAQRALQEALREDAAGRYTFLGGREVRDVLAPRPGAAAAAVRDDRGEVHEGDAVVLCTGAWLGGLVRELVPEVPVRRVRLQMMQTAPLDEKLTTSVADADSFRYYPAYGGPALDALTAGQPQPPVAAEHRMQLLMVQRADGSLTIGDTHEYATPFAFDVDEDPYRHLTQVAERLLGRRLPPVRRRWAGVYAQCTDPGRVVLREPVPGRPGTWLVTGPGGRGMTCSPAIAERTSDELGW